MKRLGCMHGQCMAWMFSVMMAVAVNQTATAEVPFVNWENHPVHAIDVSPDGSRMAIAHTADNRVQLFYIGQGYPVPQGHVQVGLDPVSVRFRNNDELWVVNHISDSVSVVDFTRRLVQNTLHTKDEPYDVVFANGRAFVSCSQANQVLVYDPQNPTAEPQSIELKAEDPRALAVHSDGSAVYVASFESGNQTTILSGGIDDAANVLTFPNNAVNDPGSPYAGQNPPANDGTQFSPALNPDLPPAPKVALIVKQGVDGRWRDDNGQDWTEFVSGNQASLSGRVPGWQLLDHDISVIDTETLSVRYVKGLMNIGMAIAFNPGTEQITLVGTDATNEVRFEPVLKGKFLRVKMGRVSANDIDHPQVMDLNPHLDYQTATIAQSERNRSIGDPRGVVWRQDGAVGYVAGMGSNNVIVINPDGHRLATIEVGEGAAGLALDESNHRLYVWNHFAASLSVVDTTSNTVQQELALFNPLPAAIKDGRKFLYDTHETSGLGQLACASCHVDGRMDRLAWDLGNPAGEVKVFNQNCQAPIETDGSTSCTDFHPMKGPMVTQTFQDIIGHEPLHWRGDRDGFEEFNGAFEGLNGDDQLLTAAEMARFKDMVATITFPPNPFREMDNSLPAAIELENHYTSGRFSPAGQPLGTGDPQRGLQLFNSGLLDGGFQCASCHTLPTGMSLNGPLLDGVVGFTLGGTEMPLGPMGENHLGVVSTDGSTQKAFKTPQLRNMYEKVGFETSRAESLAGFGFLHDGAIDSIARFISTGVFRVESDQDVADLVALMMAFSGSGLDPGDVPLSNTPPTSQDSHAGVGQQLTLTTPTQADARLEALIGVADSGQVDLVVKQGAQGSYLYDPVAQQLTASDQSMVVLSSLTSAASTDQPVTFTLVPSGLGQRLAFDRDGDGLFDQQEIQQGSDPTNAQSTTIKPFSGLWFNPQRSGHGFDLQFAGDRIFIIWFTYTDAGSPTWYLATAEYQPAWQATLNQFTWDAENRTAVAQAVGTVNLNFNSATQAALSWDIGGRTGSEPVQYFLFDGGMTLEPRTGAYFDVDDAGWGITLTTLGQTAVSLLYYFDESGAPRWVLGTGDQQNQNMEMRAYTGFCPDCEWTETSSQVVGSQSISYLADRLLEYTVSIQAPTLSLDWVINDVSLTPLSNEFKDPALQ
jgi:DNA-binding beta-propeller fold protein YncE